MYTVHNVIYRQVSHVYIVFICTYENTIKQKGLILKNLGFFILCV